MKKSLKYILCFLLVISVITFITFIIIFKLSYSKVRFNNNNNRLEPIQKVIHKIFIQNSGVMDNFQLEPKELQASHDSWKIMNPEYEIKYYSMNDCKEYLKKHFEDQDFLEAFDCLNGYANKCDFFRFCVLYNEGGWYSDWKQECLKLNLLNELDQDKDSNIIMSWDKGNDSSINGKFIQNCFIGTTKNNLFLKECINEIINNTKYKYYGESPLYPTGTGLLGIMYKKYYNKFKINLIFKDLIIYYKNNEIVKHKCYNCGLGQDWVNGNNYSDIWEKKQLYKDFKLKNTIPKIIYKTGPGKLDNLSGEILKIFNKIEKQNTDYKIKYYDDNDCYNLIKNNFEPEVLWAYNKLKPTAYKADLFRYCVLYLYGGIYSDLSQDILIPLNDLIDFEKDTLILTEDFIHNGYSYYGIQISFIACIPKLEIFKQCINNIIINCGKSYYGITPLDITGPYLFKHTLNNFNVNYIIKLYQSNGFLIDILYDNKIIKTKTSNHNKMLYNKNNYHYTLLWNNENVYN